MGTRNEKFGFVAKREIEGMKEPGVFASKATKQKFDQRKAGLREQGRAAQDAAYVAGRDLALGREMQAKPDVHVIATMKREHPGLVERMQPLTRDVELVALARQRLKERAQASVQERCVQMALRDFRGLAAKREMRMSGYDDRGDRWAAFPAELRKEVESFIQTPPAQRPALLQQVQEEMLRESKNFERVEKLLRTSNHAPRMTR